MASRYDGAKPACKQQPSGPSNVDGTELNASAVENKEGKDITEPATEQISTEEGSHASGTESEEYSNISEPAHDLNAQSLSSLLTDDCVEGSPCKPSSWNSKDSPNSENENKPRNAPEQNQSWDTKDGTNAKNNPGVSAWKSSGQWWLSNDGKDSKYIGSKDNQANDPWCKQASSWKAGRWKSKDGTSHHENHATKKTNEKKRKRKSFVADFENGGAWFVFDEVDVKPGCNADEFAYGKSTMSKEEAIDYAKEACKTNGHIGFVDVGEWQTFYYKNVDPEVAEPSLKWVNRGTQIKLYLWLSRGQHFNWSQAEMQSSRQAQNPEETAANGATG